MRFQRFRSVWLVCLLLAVSCQLAIAQVPQPQGLVNDYAGVLQPQERQALEAYLRLFRDSTSNEIAIAIFPALPQDQVLEDYTNEVFRTWGIGSKKNNNGVLIALYVQDRKARIEVGYGLEPVIPDATADQIYRQLMRPRFQQNRYFDGLTTGVQQLTKLAATEFKTPVPRTLRGKREEPNRVAALLVVLVVLAVGYWLYRNNNGGGGGYGGRRRRSGWDGPGILFLPTGWGGGYGGGGGSFGGGGGGFGGFGGGDSGGGGASGDW